MLKYQFNVILNSDSGLPTLEVFSNPRGDDTITVQLLIHSPLNVDVQWNTDWRTTIAVLVEFLLARKHVLSTPLLDQLVPHAEKVAVQFKKASAASKNTSTSPSNHPISLSAGDILKALLDAPHLLDAIPTALQTQIQAEADSRLPLNKQAWLARGVGLAATIRDALDSTAQNSKSPWVSTQSFVDGPNVIRIALPLAGAQQWYSPMSDTQIVAATMYDTDMELPEIIRIAWLITRRSLRLEHDGHDGQNAWRLDLAATFLVVDAADHVDLLSRDIDSLQRCLEFLQIQLPDAAQKQVLSLSQGKSISELFSIITDANDERV